MTDIDALLKEVSVKFAKKKSVDPLIVGKACEFKYAMERRRTSTGSFALDAATGGGWTRGAMNEIYGKEGTTKSTLMYCSGINAIINGDIWVHNDNEKMMDMNLVYDIAKAYNLDREELDANFHLLQSRNGSVIMDTIRTLAQKAKDRGIFCSIDTLTGLEIAETVDLSMLEDQRGIRARRNAEFLRRLMADMTVGKEEHPNFTVLWSAHMSSSLSTGGSEISGGNMMKYYKGTALFLKKKGDSSLDADGTEITYDMLSKGAVPVGSRIHATVTKNKSFPDGLMTSYDIYFNFTNIDGIGAGCIDNVAGVVDVATKMDIIGKSGNWLSYKDIKVNGRNAFINEVRKWFVDKSDNWTTLRDATMSYYLQNKGQSRGYDKAQEFLNDFTRVDM